MALEQKKTLKPKTARIMIGVFLLIAILFGIIDAPHYWNIGVDRAGSLLHLPLLSKIKVNESILPYRFGLDIQGGTHLVYQADVTNVAAGDRASSLEAVRDVIERRVNLFGVAEPLIQVERSQDSYRLIVELAGISDVNAAIRLIGATPFLEFKEERSVEEQEALIKKAQEAGLPVTPDAYFRETELSGKHIKRADIDFSQTSLTPQISLQLTDEGATLFAEITKKNVGKRLAIFLDGAPISTPVVQEEITGGKAQITGDFTPAEAQELVGRLNAGALPVPITLIAQQTVGASLGQDSLNKSLRAGAIGFIFVAIFMIVWYRLPGLLAVLALIFYTTIVLLIFKLIPVTLTVAGIAGFILSVGMAVDANILIFERMKEELAKGRVLSDAIREGFARAWTSIRDSNISSLITALILYWMGSSFIKGFALTLTIGILISMFSAIMVTRTLLIALVSPRIERMRSLFGSGIFRS